jgi:nifR3 family TIM-barrel protein
MFPTLRIGSNELDFPVVQAALSGYSDGAMRVIARRLGAPYTVCEVMLDQFVANVSKGRKAARYLRVRDEEHPVGAQLMGANPEDFGPAAARLVEAGFDVIDVNFGCPVRKVLGRQRGGYLLGQVDTALAIVSRVRDSVPPGVPVTVKMRRGLDDTAESREKFYQIFDGAFSLGVAAVTVHGRTVEQKYVGPSRWEFLRQVKQHAGGRVVLGSGDLFTPQACIDMLHTTGVDGVTAARGAIGNPWIFPQARALAAGLPLPPPPSVFEQREVIAEHYRLAEDLYGPELCGRQMRKFGIKYSQLHPHARQVRDAFIAVARPGQWMQVLEKWYAEDLPGRHPVEEPQELDDCQEPASAA